MTAADTNQVPPSSGVPHDLLGSRVASWTAKWDTYSAVGEVRFKLDAGFGSAGEEIEKPDLDAASFSAMVTLLRMGNAFYSEDESLWVKGT